MPMRYNICYPIYVSVPFYSMIEISKNSHSELEPTELDLTKLEFSSKFFQHNPNKKVEFVTLL